MIKVYKVNKYKLSISLCSIVGFFLAIAPVLDPYIILEVGNGFTLKLNDILMIVIGVICLFNSPKLNKRTGFLIILLFELTIVSIFGNLGSNTNFSISLKNLFVWMVQAIFLMYIWKVPCREEFFKWVEIIAVIASILVLLQFVAGYLKLNMWDGKLPFFNLSKYDGWSGFIDHNTGDIRPNSFFQEASYVGIYLSIAFIYVFKKENIKLCILYAVALLITTSLISVLSLIIVTFFMVIRRKNLNISKKMIFKILVIVVIFIICFSFFAVSNKAIGDSLNYVLGRISNFSNDLNGKRMSSTKFRILGNLPLIDNYNIYQKIFGVGIAQYSIYFSVIAYSNVIVTTVLNSGVLGFVILLRSLVFLMDNIEKNNIVYFIIFIIVICSDMQWFSWYFFYLISACLLKTE